MGNAGRGGVVLSFGCAVERDKSAKNRAKCGGLTNMEGGLKQPQP